MNATKVIQELISGNSIVFMPEPEEVWEAIDPTGKVIGEIKTTWELMSFRAQIKTNIHKSGYSIRKKNDPSVIILMDMYGRISRENYDIIGNDFSDWLDAMM